MCGIVYAHNIDGKPVNNDVMQIFDKQRNRGLQGFGLFDGQEGNIVREVREDGILQWLCKYDSNIILFHHRFPTSTDNVRRAAHPFATKKHFGKNQYILVHNGHISNAKELREEHKKLGIKYQSVTKDGRFNDSEALLWDFALTMEKKQEKMTARGNIAFICVKQVNGKLNKLLFGRNTNPLVMKIDPSGVRLSSQGEGEAIADNHLYQYVYKTNMLSKKPFEIPANVYSGTQNSGFRGESNTQQNWNWQNRQYAHHTAPRVPQAGDWLPTYLRKKFAKYLPAPENDPNFIDYDRDGNPVYFDSNEFDSYDDYYTQRKNRETMLLLPAVSLSEDKQEELETVSIDEGEVYQLAFEYLAECEGNFEQAYFMAEADYEVMFEVPEEDQDEEYLQQVLIMEGVLSEINSDPEYVDEFSVSSTWLPLSQQMLTV